jgi:hypothetical protein
MGDASGHIGLTAGINIFTSRDLGRFMFTLQLQYNSFNWHSRYERGAAFTSGTQREQIDFRFKMNTVSFSPLINYAFLNTENKKIYGGFGMNFNVSSYPENEYTVENITTGSKESKNRYEFENVWLSFPARIGVNTNKFDVSLSASLIGGFSSVSNFKGKYNSKSLTIAYQF